MDFGLVVIAMATISRLCWSCFGFAQMFCYIQNGVSYRRVVLMCMPCRFKFGQVDQAYFDASVVDFLSFFVISALVAVVGGVCPVYLPPVCGNKIGFKKLGKADSDIVGGRDVLGYKLHASVNVPSRASVNRFSTGVFPVGFGLYKVQGVFSLLHRVRSPVGSVQGSVICDNAFILSCGYFPKLLKGLINRWHLEHWNS